MYPSEGNRQMILEQFKTAIVSGAIKTESPNLVREMNTFTWQKMQRRMQARALDIVGTHDDCVFAAAYAWFIVHRVRSRQREERWAPEILRTENGRVVHNDEDSQKPWMWV